MKSSSYTGMGAALYSALFRVPNKACALTAVTRSLRGGMVEHRFGRERVSVHTFRRIRHDVHRIAMLCNTCTDGDGRTDGRRDDGRPFANQPYQNQKWYEGIIVRHDEHSKPYVPRLVCQ